MSILEKKTKKKKISKARSWKIEDIIVVGSMN